MKAVLALADGKVFEGEHFGAENEVEAEIVFNTSMSGYQEIITDPSYCGQMVVMTYPLIGNYGINPEDFESDRPYLSGFIIKELSRVQSNWRSRGNLEDFLKIHPGTYIAADIEKLLIAKGVTNYKNLAGNTTIQELINRISSLNLFITSDSFALWFQERCCKGSVSENENYDPNNPTSK